MSATRKFTRANCAYCNKAGVFVEITHGELHWQEAPQEWLELLNGDDEVWVSSEECAARYSQQRGLLSTREDVVDIELPGVEDDEEEEDEPNNEEEDGPWCE